MKQKIFNLWDWVAQLNCFSFLFPDCLASIINGVKSRSSVLHSLAILYQATPFHSFHIPLIYYITDITFLIQILQQQHLAVSEFHKCLYYVSSLILAYKLKFFIKTMHLTRNVEHYVYRNEI